MTAINGRACVVNGTPVNKVFSDGRQVYGRNWLPGTRDWLGWNKNLPERAEIFELITEAGVNNKVLHIKNSFGYVPIGMYGYPTNQIKVGEAVTQSIMARGHGQVRLTSNGILKTFTIDSDTYTKIHVTGNVENGAAFTVYVTDIGEIWCHSPKLETGSLATPWNPAPEDVL